VGLIGARRRRQGLGPFVARDFTAAGAAVTCFLATSESTREAALPALREACGHAPRGYVELTEMLAQEEIDAVAILSPAEHHVAHLEAVARASVHVLCEKPFVWGLPDLVARSGALVDAIEARGCAVWENCQWPYALPDLEALHPGALDAPPRRFEMELQPASTGLQSLADSMPHPLSLLQTLAPGPDARVEDVCFSTRDPQSCVQTVRFRYRSGGCEIEAEVRLEASSTQPRRAAIALDGRRARRVVAPEDYRLFFADANRSVPLADPLTRLVADFVAALDGARTRGREITQRMQLLADIVDAYANGEAR
jgi:predicted dehydrogenase